MGITFIIKMIVAPLFLSVAFLVIALTGGSIGSNLSDRLYFAFASVVTACLGCLGIWIYRKPEQPIQEASAENSTQD
jgi:hypothetical protein